MTPQFRHVLSWLAVGAAIAAVLGLMAWILLATHTLVSITGGSRILAVLILAGVVGTGALAGVLMWLAFYSARKGYDDPPDYDRDET